MSEKKKIYFGTNTKMYKTIADTINFIQELQNLTRNISRNQIELFVIPSYTSLKDANQIKNKDLLKIGAQNMGWEEQGQFTGEISPLMLKEVGTDIVMIGHSERRHILGETDEEENKKVLCSLNNDFITLLCVGETKEQKQYGISNETIRIQLKKDLYHVNKEKVDKLWIAYEPVWAIGVNGTPASKEYVEQIHIVIRDTLIELFGDTAGNRIPVLYGGSVNEKNSKEIFDMNHVDGLFIGRAAWDAQNFNRIIRNILRNE